jgi:hypothetical protein
VKAILSIVCVLASGAVFLCALMYAVTVWELGSAFLNGALREHWLFAGWSGDLATQLGRAVGKLVAPGVGIWMFGRIAQWAGLKAGM